MDRGTEEIRTLIAWGQAYKPEWDSQPSLYATEGLVGWGRSRRLGKLAIGPVKAYIGVQHIDPAQPGWSFIREAEARFFASLFLSGQVVTLRTFPTMEQALAFLLQFLRSGGRSF